MAEDQERIVEDSVTETSPNINSMPSELPGQKVGLSMELPIFLIMLSLALSAAPVSNIILYRTCVHALDHTVEECQFFLSPDKSYTNTTKHLEEEVQKYTTFVSTVKIIIESVLPAVLSFFMGVWSDTHGRKPLVVWPLFGLCFTSISLVAYCVLGNLGPWWYILTAVPYSLTGALFPGLCFTSISLVAYCVLDNLGPWWYILTAVPYSLTGALFPGLCFTSISLVAYCVLDNLGPWWYILTAVPYSLTGALFPGLCFTSISLVAYCVLDNLRPWWYILTAVPYSLTGALFPAPVLWLCFTSISLVAYCVLDNLGPWWYILTAVPYSLTGGFMVMFTGAFCFISDVTTTQNRSLRMTVLEAAISIGSVVGSVASSYLLRAVGNVYLLLITATLNVIAYAFTNICIKESLTGAVRGGITTVLDLLLVKEMIRECFKRRPNKGRAQILLLTAANSLSIFILYGLMSLQYLYTREKLNWAIKDYTIYSATSTSLAFAGAMLGVGVLQKLFRISDLAFAIIAFLSTTSDYIVRIFATTSWHMYLGASISVFKDLSAPLMRSMLTKILPIEDIAKVFSLMCALEGICPLIAPAMFNSLYSLTIDQFPGAIYVLGTFITTICVILLGFVQYYRCKTGSSSIAYTVLDQ